MDILIWCRTSDISYCIHNDKQFDSPFLFNGGGGGAVSWRIGESVVQHRRLLLIVIIHGRIAGRWRLVAVFDAFVRVVGWISHDRHLVDGLLVGGWVLVAGRHVRRVDGRADRVDVVDWVTENRTDNDYRLWVYCQEQVDNQGQAPANDEDDVGRLPPITCD